MLITDRFVYVHMPKTGGTFVEQVVRQIHQNRGDTLECRLGPRPEASTPRAVARRLLHSARSLVSRRTRATGAHGMVSEYLVWNGAAYDQHGIVSDIPPEHAHKPILATMRNPYDHYVSEYEFKWWMREDHRFQRIRDQVQARFPSFPALTFEEFVELCSAPHGRPGEPLPSTPPDAIGRLTRMFMRFYFQTPPAGPQIRGYLPPEECRRRLHPDIRFIFTEDLNRQLRDFLVSVGYSESETVFILKAGRILPKQGGRSPSQKWQSYYTPDLLRRVRHLERLLFELFPQYDDTGLPVAGAPVPAPTP